MQAAKHLQEQLITPLPTIDLNMKNFKKFSAFAFILVINSCANVKNSTNQYETTLETIEFKCEGTSDDCTNSKYSLTKSLDDREFILKDANSSFFKGNDIKYNYLYQVFKSRFLLITPIKLPHNLSSIDLASRDYVFVYDLETKKSYHFEAKGFYISSFKPTNPLISIETIQKSKRDGYNITTVIDSIDEKDAKIYLVLLDLKSKEVIRLISGLGNIPD